MENHTHDGHRHSHPHSHSSPRNHVAPHPHTRRDFLRTLLGATISSASLIELAWHRAAWARTAEPLSDAPLFDLHKASDGVYFAAARPQTVINCNAAIFVRSKDVVVVDAHSKPSAAAALIAQIRRELTPKPVRYVVNTHFHWDHTQGDHAYRQSGSPIDFIATDTTKQLMSGLAVKRLNASIDAVSKQIDQLRQRASKSASDAEKAFCTGEIRHLQAYQAEMKDYTLELPTITFSDSYLLNDSAFDLHLGFHGRSHTAGDVFVFCPQGRTIATGDASHGWVPNIADGYPHMWPATIDKVAQLDFKYVLGGHGPMQPDRTIMTCQRNYIEELTQKVQDGKRAGLTIAELQARLTVASLRSMQSNGYQAFLTRVQAAGHPHFSDADLSPLQIDVNGNIGDIFRNLDRG